MICISLTIHLIAVGGRTAAISEAFFGPYVANYAHPEAMRVAGLFADVHTLGMLCSLCLLLPFGCCE